MKCERCGSDNGRITEISDEYHVLCMHCSDDLELILDGISKIYVEEHAEFFIGFKAKDLPELKRLFALSEDEDIRKLVGFLEEVEADLPQTLEEANWKRS